MYPTFMYLDKNIPTSCVYSLSSTLSPLSSHTNTQTRIRPSSFLLYLSFLSLQNSSTLLSIFHKSSRKLYNWKQLSITHDLVVKFLNFVTDPNQWDYPHASRRRLLRPSGHPQSPCCRLLSDLMGNIEAKKKIRPFCEEDCVEMLV